jgi:ribose transport system ATP-binding protein
MFLRGTKYEPSDPLHAQDLGLSFIHQELNIFDNLSIEDNIFAGSYPYTKGPFIDYARIREEARKALAELGLIINPRKKVQSLSPGEKQLVEIAKAITRKAAIVIFDEPTSSLSEAEKQKLFSVILKLRDDGAAIIFISHLLNEIMELCDRVVVLRDGKLVGDVQKAMTTHKDIAKLMVGRELEEFFPKVISHKQSVKMLEVKSLTANENLTNVSFSIYSGEIVGMWGLLGSGRTEVARAVFGLDAYQTGSIYVGGKAFLKMSPRRAIANGMILISENRREEGIIGKLSLKINVALPSLRRITKGFLNFLDFKEEVALAKAIVQRLNIRASSIEQLTETLSGGNQQKAVLGKWLALDPKIIILDEPTRGIDVGAKSEIYKLIANLAERGTAILFISSDIEEVLRLSNRILIIRDGTIIDEIDRDFASVELLMKRATG